MNPAALARAQAQAIWPGATPVRRTLGGIVHQHPSDPEREMFDGQTGGRWHYGAAPYTEQSEIDTAWVASGGAWDYEVTKNDFHSFVRDSVPVAYRYYDNATGHYVELTFSAVQWVNDEGQSESAASFGQVTPTIDDDKITWSEIAPGWSVSINAQTARLAKLIDIDSLTNLGAPTIGGTNQRLRISIQFQKSSGLEVWSDGVKWGEVNNTWQETTGNLEFRSISTQQPVFWFKKPWAEDSAGSHPEIMQRVRRLGVNYFAEVDVPWSWLQSASYPITIDPTIDEQVVASGDDGYWSSQPYINITSGDMTMGYYSADHPDCSIWARFDNFTVPAGATIDTASPDLLNRYAGTRDVTVMAYFDDVDDAVAPTTAVGAQVLYSTHTDAGTSFSMIGSISTVWCGYSNYFIDFATALQEVVNRPGYADGQAVMYTLIEQGSSSNSMYFTSYNYSTTDAPKIHVEYTTGGGTSIPVMVDSYRRRRT